MIHWVLVFVIVFLWFYCTHFDLGLATTSKYLLQPWQSLWAVLFSARVEILCAQRLCIRDRPVQTWHSRSWHPYCRRSFWNKIGQLLFSWPEIGIFINGPTVKGSSEPGPVFLICCSLVGAAAIGCCEGSTIMSVLPHCEWCLSPTEYMLWPEQQKGRIVNVYGSSHQSSTWLKHRWIYITSYTQ